VSQERSPQDYLARCHISEGFLPFAPAATVNDGKPIRILIADDSASMRKVLRSFLEELSNLEICAVARDGAEALESARVLKPDILILDVAMPQLNGVEVASIAKKMLPRAKVILFTMYDDRIGETLAKHAGVDVVLAKTGGITALTDKITSVLEQWIPAGAQSLQRLPNVLSD